MNDDKISSNADKQLFAKKINLILSVYIIVLEKELQNLSSEKALVYYRYLIRCFKNIIEIYNQYFYSNKEYNSTLAKIDSCIGETLLPQKEKDDLGLMFTNHVTDVNLLSKIMFILPMHQYKLEDECGWFSLLKEKIDNYTYEDNSRSEQPSESFLNVESGEKTDDYSRRIISDRICELSPENKTGRRKRDNFLKRIHQKEKEKIKRYKYPDWLRDDIFKEKNIDINKEDQINTETMISNENSMSIDKVEFAVIFPKQIKRGETFQMDFAMYEKEECKSTIEDIKSSHDYDTNVTKTGYKSVVRRAEITVKLSSEDLPKLDDEAFFIWEGESSREQFMVDIPSNYKKNTLQFTFDIYGNCFKISTIKVLIPFEKKKEDYRIFRRDVKKAFISYSSEDRYEVAILLQGMHAIAPNTEIFFDIKSLRQGENWKETIPKMIDESNVLYLCWSHNAYASKWVKKEYKYGIKKYGAEFIEPLPLEMPSKKYPVPKALSDKHFNDIYLLIRNTYRKNG